MNFSLTSVVFNAAELSAESGFWHRLLGGTITETATHHFVQVDGLPVIVIQHAPDQVSPQWPDGPDQQLHQAGGRRLRPVGDESAQQQDASRVYASPAGHPFCLRVAH